MTRMKQIILIGMLVVLLAPLQASAQEWVQIYKTDDIDSADGMMGRAWDIVIMGDTAFVAWNNDDGHLSSFDIGDSLLDTHDFDDASGRGFVIDDGDGFVACGSDGLHIVNVSDAGDLSPRDDIKTAGSAYDVAIGGENGDYAFVAVLDAGLEIINVSNRDTIDTVTAVLDLTVIDTVNDTLSDTFSVSAQTVDAYSIYVHVGGGGSKSTAAGTLYASYSIIDVFDVDSPKVVGGWVSNDWSHFGLDCQWGLDIEVHGSYTYLAVDDDHIFVFSNTAYEDTAADSSCYPCYLRTVTTNGSAKGLAIEGDYLYSASQADGRVDAFYLGDPSNPKAVGTYYHGSGSSERLDVVDDRLLVAVQRVSTDTPAVLILCQEFSRGDVDDDGEIDDDDVGDLTDYVFYSSPTPEPGEWNGDVEDSSTDCDPEDPTVNVADVILLNNFVNNGGDPPDCSVEPCE